MNRLLMNRLLSISLAALAIAAGSSAADARPLTRSMGCAQAQALVARQGAIVLDTDKHIYDRYVRSRAFCMITEATEPAWVPTKDNPQCMIGYTCTQSPDWYD